MKILSIALTLCLLLAVTVSTEAAGKSKKKTPAPAADTSDRITAVHLTSISINVFATHAAKAIDANKLRPEGSTAMLTLFHGKIISKQRRVNSLRFADANAKLEVRS